MFSGLCNGGWSVMIMINDNDGPLIIRMVDDDDDDDDGDDEAGC